jgi:hypothetical protein
VLATERLITAIAQEFRRLFDADCSIGNLIDIKPVMREFLPEGEIRQTPRSHEVMKNYWR